MTPFFRQVATLLLAAAIWGGAIESAWAQTILFSGNFDGSPPLAGWTQENVEGARNWETATSRFNSPPRSAFFNEAPAGLVETWLITPAIDFSSASAPILQYFENVNLGARTDIHEVLISTNYDGSNFGSATWTSLREGTSAEDTWVMREIDLSAHGGAAEAHIAFRYGGDLADEWYIDDVLVFQPNFFSVEVNQLDSDAFAEVGVQRFYSVEIRNAGVMMDSFTIEMPSGAWTDGYFLADQTTPFPFTSFPLAPNEARVIEVAVTPPAGAAQGEMDTEMFSVSGAGGSMAEAEIITTAAVPMGLPFPLESFEGTTFPPAGWTLQDIGMTPTGRVWERTPIEAQSGGFSARHPRNPTGGANTWLISPPIDLATAKEPKVRFYDRTDFAFDAILHNAFVLTNYTGDAPSATRRSLNFSFIGPEDQWMEYEYDLTPEAGQVVRLGFQYVGENASVWYIDDIEVFDAAAPEPGRTGFLTR
jgi:hypothetical protein